MPPPSHLALATCSSLPEWECDDEPLHRALAGLGVSFEQPVWDDPSVDWSSFAAVLIRTTWDYAERRDEFLAWARRVESSTHLHNPAAVVTWNTDKRYLADLERDGVRIAPTIWLERGEGIDVRATMREHGWSAGFLKPRVGATSRETLRFVADAEGCARASAHLARLLPREAMMLQPYLADVETAGEVSVPFVEGRITHAVRKTPVAGDYRTQDDFGAHDEPTELTIAQRRVVDDVVRRFSELLYGRVDLLDTEDGPVVNEVELVEPSLFFRHGPEAADRLAAALVRRG